MNTITQKLAGTAIAIATIAGSAAATTATVSMTTAAVIAVSSTPASAQRIILKCTKPLIPNKAGTDCIRPRVTRPRCRYVTVTKRGWSESGNSVRESLRNAIKNWEDYAGRKYGSVYANYRRADYKSERADLRKATVSGKIYVCRNR